MFAEALFAYPPPRDNANELIQKRSNLSSGVSKLVEETVSSCRPHSPRLGRLATLPADKISSVSMATSVGTLVYDS